MVLSSVDADGLHLCVSSGEPCWCFPVPTLQADGTGSSKEDEPSHDVDCGLGQQRVGVWKVSGLAGNNFPACHLLREADCLGTFSRSLARARLC